MALDLRRPTPYAKRGDQIIPLTPNHYMTLFHGVERKDSTGAIVSVSGRIQYDTQRLYVCDGNVYESEQKRVPLDQLTDLYPWFWEEYSKAPLELRKEMKLGLPEEQVASAEFLSTDFLSTWEQLPEAVRQQLAAQYNAPPAEQVGKMWTCPDCGEEVTTKAKSVHVVNNHPKVKKVDE